MQHHSHKPEELIGHPAYLAGWSWVVKPAPRAPGAVLWAIIGHFARAAEIGRVGQLPSLLLLIIGRGSINTVRWLLAASWRLGNSTEYITSDIQEGDYKKKINFVKGVKGLV